MKPDVCENQRPAGCSSGGGWGEAGTIRLGHLVFKESEKKGNPLFSFNGVVKKQNKTLNFGLKSSHLCKSNYIVTAVEFFALFSLLCNICLLLYIMVY